jgi:hypothetical protein
MAVPKARVCIDCANDWGGGPEPKWRPAPFPGPRCHTHNRIEKKRKRAVRQNSYQVRNFGITLEEKQELIEFQGGGCICADWTGYNGKTRSLSTDHDHVTGVIRGALCKHCNDLLGRVRDDPRYFARMMAYLENPPAVRLLGKRIAPEVG